jgi:hypothetical protein
MRYKLYINGVLFHDTSNNGEAFALFSDWTAQGHNVRLKFVRLQPLSGGEMCM